MTDTLEIFGTEYTGVTGIKATDNNGNVLTYTRGDGSATEFIVILSQNQQGVWTPDCTFAELYAAYSNGLDIAFRADDSWLPVDGAYDEDSECFSYAVFDYDDTIPSSPYYTINYYIFDSSGVSEDSSDTVYFLYDGNASASDVASGKIFYNSSGRQVGTATGGSATLQTKSVSYTPTETAQSETVTADSGYDGLDAVNVSVGAISSTYVGTGITRRSSSDLTASGATVTVPSGYYSAQVSKAVASGTAGTPTATKGTVSNHSVSVTPKVTNTTGYITGSTKTGTAVTVSASELVSGSQTITDNGTTDVTNLASVTVAVPFVTYYTGTGAPSSSTGSNGDIYLKVVG